MPKLPLWEKNPGVFAHIGWEAEAIMESGPDLLTSYDRHCNLEGLGFSVSIHPLQWARIMSDSLGIDNWGDIPVLVLTFNKPALDYYAFVKPFEHLQSSEEITEWAVREGWIKRGTDLLVYNEDEFGWDRIEKETARSTRGKQTKTVPGWRPTAALKRHVSRFYPNPVARCLESEVLNLWLADQHPRIGMVWYEHPYYPQYASIPQGHILPHHFNAVHPVAVTNVYKWPRFRKSL